MWFWGIAEDPKNSKLDILFSQISDRSISFIIIRLPSSIDQSLWVLAGTEPLHEQWKLGKMARNKSLHCENLPIILLIWGRHWVILGC